MTKNKIRVLREGINSTFQDLGRDNLYHIGIILYEKRQVKMDDKNEELYSTLFKDMTPVEYLKISRAAQWETLKPNMRIITQGMLVPD